MTNVEAIRKEVHAFYGRKEYSTLDSLLGVLKDKNLFQGALWKVLHEIGFCHKKYQNKQYIYEQARIIARHDYLHHLRRNHSPAASRPVVYLDETWVNAHHGRGYYVGGQAG